MKISNISIINPFAVNFESKKQNHKKVSAAKTSEISADSTLNYLSNSNPFAKIYETKIDALNDSGETYEYFHVEKDIQGRNLYIPIKGTVVSESGKLKLSEGMKYSDFNGIELIRRNNQVIQENRYIKGYPVAVTDYKDGKEYRYRHYSQNTHRINEIYYFDGSFELAQKVGPQDNYVKTEFQSLNEYGEKFVVSMTATKKEDAKGIAQCCVPTDDGYKTAELRWNYPRKYSFCGKTEDAKILKQALIKLQEAINQDEYKNDFGSNSYFNEELSDVIYHLSII